MNYHRPELLDHLAREYALGTLQGPARRRFIALMRDSSTIAAAVAAWEARLAVMERAPVLVPPPVSTWRGIEQRLFPTHPAAATQGAADRASDRATSGGRAAGGGAGSGSGSSWWRWLSGRTLGGALAGLLVAVLVVKTMPGTVGLEPVSDGLPASYVGVLSAGDEPASVVVSSLRHGKQLTVKVLRPIVVPQGRRAMLWAIPKEGAPWLVGTVAPSGQTHITLPAESEKLFFTVNRVAISFEAADDTAPTVPSAFVLQGACVKVW